MKKALGVLKSIAGNDQVKEAIVETGCVEQILAAMDKHQANPMVRGKYMTGLYIAQGELQYSSIYAHLWATY